MPEEKEIKLIPEFYYIPSGWFPKYIKTQMKDAKASEKIDLPWMGYFFLGGRENQNSKCFSRFNPSSKYYQAWFGAYLIKNRMTEEKGVKPFGFYHGFPNFNILIRAGIGDQCSWLAKYNTENAFCNAIKMGDQDPELFSIQNKTGYIWKGSLITLSDIDRNGSVDWRYNTLFGKPEEKYFDIVDEHHLTILDGFYICGYDKESNVTWIVYGVASRFVNKYEELISNYSVLEKELIPMAAAVKLVPIE